MNFEKFLSFIQSNIDYLWTDDVKLVVEGKYYTLFEKLKKRSDNENNKKVKAKLEQITYFITEFLEDYNTYSYKYDYSKATTFEHYKYWFNFYLNSKFLLKAQRVIEDMKTKFPWDKRVASFEKKIGKEQSSYNKEYDSIKYNLDKTNKIKFIDTLIGQGEYGQATSEVLKYIQEYPDDQSIGEYIQRIDKLKSQNLVENITVNKNYFEKIWLLWLTKKEELKSTDMNEIYKKLNLLKSNWDYEWWLSLIKYIKDKFKIDDVKLLKYYNAFTDISAKKQQKKQKDEYTLEINSLKLLVKNKQYEEALTKATSILKKYPLVSKRDILALIKTIKDKRSSLLKNHTKWKLDLFLENLTYKMSPLTKKWLFQFYQKMAWFLNAKMDLKLSLQVVYYQAKDIWLKKFIKDVLDWIDSWMKLSEIMKWYWAVWKLDIALIKIWESTWKLWDMFQTIYKSYKEEDERKKKIKSVMIYPAIIIFVTIMIFIGLLVFIIPKFVQLFEQINMNLPAITQITINLSEFIRTKWYILLFWVFWTIIFMTLFKLTSPWKRFFSLMSLNLPVLKELVYRKYIIFFSWNLSLLLKSWINLLEAIDLLVEWTDNVYYQNEFKRVRFELETWITFSKAVWLGNISDVWNYRNSYVPIDLAYAVDVWERTWQLWDLLWDVSARYDEDLKLIIKNLQSMMEPFVIILVGTVIFIFVLAVFLPMIQMYNAIGKMSNM